MFCKFLIITSNIKDRIDSKRIACIFPHLFTCLDVDLYRDDDLYSDLYATCPCSGFCNLSVFYFCRGCWIFGSAFLSLSHVRELFPDRVRAASLAPGHAPCAYLYDPRRIWNKTRSNGSMTSVVSTQRGSICVRTSVKVDDRSHPLAKSANVLSEQRSRENHPRSS